MHFICSPVELLWMVICLLCVMFIWKKIKRRKTIKKKFEKKSIQKRFEFGYCRLVEWMKKLWNTALSDAFCILFLSSRKIYFEKDWNSNKSLFTFLELFNSFLTFFRFFWTPFSVYSKRFVFCFICFEVFFWLKSKVHRKSVAHKQWWKMMIWWLSKSSLFYSSVIFSFSFRKMIAFRLNLENPFVFIFFTLFKWANEHLKHLEHLCL